MICTKTTTHTAGIHNTHALINERIYAQGDQCTHHDQSPPHQYTRRTSTTLTTPNQYTITTLTPIRRDRTNLPPARSPPPLPPTHTCHIRQALRNLLRPIRSILPILRAVMSLLVRGIPVTSTPPRTLTHVSYTRGRVLCSKYHSKNDDAFQFCQWWASPSTYGSRDSDTALLCIDEYAFK